jgi:hypothetical protein
MRMRGYWTVGWAMMMMMLMIVEFQPMGNGNCEYLPYSAMALRKEGKREERRWKKKK